MNDGVPCGETNSIRDAYHLLKDCKRLDKECGCKGVEYYFELEEETDDTIYYQEVKIYKRGNKIFMKTKQS